MSLLRYSAIFLLWVGCRAHEHPTVETPEYYSFEMFIEKYGKVYETEEELIRRKSIFERNRKKVLQHEIQGDSSYTLGITQFCDMDEEEMPFGYDKSFHSSWRSKTSYVSKFQQKRGDNLKLDDTSILIGLPESVDWRLKDGVTTPVKNQGRCGSCWAFASAAALESHLAIQTNTLFSLSMQEFVSCVPNPKECGGDGGCTGSTPEIAYDFVAKYGVVEEWSFGYQSYHGEHVNCTIMQHDDANQSKLRGADKDGDFVKGAVASIAGFSNLPTNSYSSLMAAVATMGPVVVAVAASGWGLYRSGVYEDDKAETRDLNHAVVVEGYGTDQETGQKYWLVRNSWGPRWGEDGYIRLKRVGPSTLDNPTTDCKLDDKPGDGVACKKDDNGNEINPKSVQVCGTCGILFDAVVPIGGHLL